MAYDVEGALDLIDLALGRAAEIVDPASLDSHATIAKGIRRRLGFLGHSVVVALVGGTGSGKSSLLNALAGEAVAPTGVLRPTTERPLAWIPANPEPGLVRLLDDLGVDERVGHNTFGEIAILDLPDTDSVVQSHRHIVEYLLPKVDAVVWVLDPEKYNDRLLHRDFLQPLCHYASQFVFVLNQIDRLSPAEEGQVVADIRRILNEDGFPDAQLLAVAADPDEGPPIGIARLDRDLHGRFEAKQVVMGKVIADLREVSDGISEATGIQPGEGTAYDDRWDATAGQVVSTLVDSMGDSEPAAASAGRQTALRRGGGPIAALVSWLRSTRFSRVAGMTEPAGEVQLRTGTHLTRAASIVGGFVGDLSFETGGSFGRGLRSGAVPDDLEVEIGRVVEGSALEVGEFRVTASARWWRAAGAVQWLLAALLLAGVIWMWADPASVGPGGDTRPLLMVIGSLVAGLLLRALVTASGRNAGRKSFEHHVEMMRTSLRAGLDRRVGAPLRARMRSRAEVAGALAELGIFTAALEQDLARRDS